MAAFKRLFGNSTEKKARIVLVGLDNSGKTSILQCLKPKKAALETVPTIGFTTEEFHKHGVNFSAFDMSGQSRYRNLWEHYYGDVEGIIVVIDATDKLRFVVIRYELETMLSDPKVAEKKIPILFLCNKMDILSASSPEEITAALALDTITDRPWHVAACEALRGVGVEESIKWLADAMSKQ